MYYWRFRRNLLTPSFDRKVNDIQGPARKCRGLFRLISEHVAWRLRNYHEPLLPAPVRCYSLDLYGNYSKLPVFMVSHGVIRVKTKQHYQAIARLHSAAKCSAAYLSENRARRQYYPYYRRLVF